MDKIRLLLSLLLQVSFIISMENSGSIIIKSPRTELVKEKGLSWYWLSRGVAKESSEGLEFLPVKVLDKIVKKAKLVDDETIRGVIAKARINSNVLESSSKKETSPVASLAYSPDGEQIVSGLRNGNIKVWSTSTSKCIADLKGHCGVVNSVVYSPDGEQIASGSDDTTIRLWEASIKKKPLSKLANKFRRHVILKGHTKGVFLVAYSPDVSQFISGACDGTIKIWNSKSGECIHTLCVNEDIISIDYAEADRTLVSKSGSEDSFSIRMWNLETGECCDFITSQNQSDWEIHPSLDLSATEYQNLKNNTVLRVAENGGKEPLERYPCSPDKGIRAVHVADSLNTLILFSNVTRYPICSLEGESSITSFAWSPDSAKLATSFEDGKIAIWRDFQKIREFAHRNERLTHDESLSVFKQCKPKHQ